MARKWLNDWGATPFYGDDCHPAAHDSQAVAFVQSCLHTI